METRAAAAVDRADRLLPSLALALALADADEEEDMVVTGVFVQVWPEWGIIIHKTCKPGHR